MNDRKNGVRWREVENCATLSSIFDQLYLVELTLGAFSANKTKSKIPACAINGKYAIICGVKGKMAEVAGSPQEKGSRK